jgi:hypothetical protein
LQKKREKERLLDLLEQKKELSDLVRKTKLIYTNLFITSDQNGKIILLRGANTSRQRQSRTFSGNREFPTQKVKS